MRTDHGFGGVRALRMDDAASDSLVTEPSCGVARYMHAWRNTKVTLCEWYNRTCVSSNASLLYCEQYARNCISRNAIFASLLAFLQCQVCFFPDRASVHYSADTQDV